MSNLVIVAIPDENDRVWKISSEKVPHLTVLFLGEVDNVTNLEQIVGFVEHAASQTLRRFCLTVDRRGELGADQADVLFFKKNRYDFKAIRDFRASLLQDDNIKTAYDGATQFEGLWYPHLTLGYPADPAKPESDNMISGFYSVDFNKIAVWIDDFDGPEFLLKDYWDEYETLESSPVDVAMSDICLSELAHFGVKGMRWGQKKAEVHPDIADVPEKTRKDASNDAEEFTRAKLFFGEGAGTRRKLIKAQVEEKKKDPQYAKAFDHFVKQTDLGQRAVQAKKERKHTNRKTATKKTAKGVGHVLRGNSQYANTAAVVGVGAASYLYKRHAQQSDDIEDAMTQTADVGADFLEHFGVKGMRWGVRKEDVASGARAAGSAAKAAGGGVAKAAGAVVRFAGDVQFENKVADGRAREAVVNGAYKPFKKEDLPAVKSRHGDYGKLKNRAKKPFSKEARAYRKDAKETYIKRLESTANSMKNLSGNREYTIRERGIDQPAEGGALPKSKLFWDVSARNVKHALEDDFTRLEVVMEDGYITDLKPVEIENSMAQTVELGEAFLMHYGVKGMRWGVRKSPEEEGGKREGIQKFLDPQGHSLKKDVVKNVLLPFIPVVGGIAAAPSTVRLTRGGFRAGKAFGEHKSAQRTEKKDAKALAAFERTAKSAQGFAAIHNGAHAAINKDLDGINKRHPDPNKTTTTRKKYDAEVLKSMQTRYRESANSLTNKKVTHHVDVEFVGDGKDVKIHVKEGPPKPMVEHTATVDGDTVTFTGKIKRDAQGYITGLEFEEFKEKSVAHSELEDEVGEFLLEHYGVKGMHWGVSKAAEDGSSPTAVKPTGQSRVPHGDKRKTKIDVEGGQNHPAHGDALKVAEAKAKLRKSGVHTLSNTELKEMKNRIELEAQVKSLMTKKGRKFAGRQLENVGQQTIQRGAARGIAKGAAKAGGAALLFA